MKNSKYYISRRKDGKLVFEEREGKIINGVGYCRAGSMWTATDIDTGMWICKERGLDNCIWKVGTLQRLIDTAKRTENNLAIARALAEYKRDLAAATV